MEAAAPAFVPAVIEPAPVVSVPERSVRRRSRQAHADGMIELEIDAASPTLRGALWLSAELLPESYEWRLYEAVGTLGNTRCQHDRG